MKPARKRVLAIGIDGATFDLIKPWTEEGRLPHLGRLMENGTQGPLASTLQPTSAPAWVTFMTGLNQGRHGLYDFVRRRPGTYDVEVTNAGHVAGPTMFDVASQQGLRVVTINIPYTSPPRPVNGVSIGGPFAPAFSRDVVFPPDFFHELNDLVPGYFILPDYDARAADPLSDFSSKLLRGIELRERLGLHLLKTRDWDLFTVVFTATDEAQHTYWSFQAAPKGSPQACYQHVIRDIYERIDRAIGAMLRQIATEDSDRETVIIVLSDHGGGSFRWMINLNRWLAEAGYLRYRTDRGGSLRGLWADAIKRLISVYRHRLPGELRAAIRSQLGAQRFDKVKGSFESALLTSNIAWDQTLAYALGAGGNIFINLRDREPSGIVEAGPPYEELRQRLINDLMTLSDPETGRPIIEHVHRRENLYHGPHLDQAPDLIIQWKDYAYWGRGRYDSRGPVFEAQDQFDFTDQPLSGAHRMNGILIAAGPGVQPGTQLEGARLLDLAPSILALLGIPAGDRMDGQVLEQIASKPERDEDQDLYKTGDGHPAPRDEVAYTTEEADKISERLRSLGYL